MSIPEKNLASRKPNSGAWALDEVVQANHRWDVPGPRRGMKDGAVDLEDLRLAAVDQNEGAPRMANVQWLIVLV